MSKRKHVERKSSNEADRETLLQEKKEVHDESDIRGDRRNIAILFFLYLLQGVPIGLASAIPMLLQNRGASYKVISCIFVIKIIRELVNLDGSPLNGSQFLKFRRIKMHRLNT